MIQPRQIPFLGPMSRFGTNSFRYPNLTMYFWLLQHCTRMTIRPLILCYEAIQISRFECLWSFHLPSMWGTRYLQRVCSMKRSGPHLRKRMEPASQRHKKLPKPRLGQRWRPQTSRGPLISMPIREPSCWATRQWRPRLLHPLPENRSLRDPHHWQKWEMFFPKQLPQLSWRRLPMWLLCERIAPPSSTGAEC